MTIVPNHLQKITYHDDSMHRIAFKSNEINKAQLELFMKICWRCAYELRQMRNQYEYQKCLRYNWTACAPVYVCHIESHEFRIFECNNMVLCVAARDGIKNIIVSQPARGPLCHVSHYNSIRIIF